MTPTNIAQAWSDCCTNRDLQGLLRLSDPEIEIVGPRGSAFGVEILKGWFEGTILELETLRSDQEGESVLLLQVGRWRSPESNEIIGERTIASHFTIRNDRVVRYQRFDNPVKGRPTE